MSKIAFIYPGQGAQHMGMGKEFFDAFESVRTRFEECSGLLGYDMAELCFTENDRQGRFRRYIPPPYCRCCSHSGNSPPVRGIPRR